MITMRKILITGSSGFIASQLIKILKNNFDVVALTRNKDKLAFKDVKYIVGDVSNNLPKFPKVDIILHFAGIPLTGSNNPLDYFEVNSYGTYNVLTKALEANVKNFIFASSMYVYDVNKLNINEETAVAPSNSYGESKVVAENVCRYFANHLNFKVIVLRYSGVYGATRPKGLIYNSFRNAIENKKIRIKTSPESKFDSIYVKDVVGSMLKTIEFIQNTEDKFNIFNIGYGKPIKLEYLLEKIIKMTNSKSDVEYLNEVSDTNFCMDIGKAKKLLDYSPTKLDDSLFDYYSELLSVM